MPNTARTPSKHHPAQNDTDGPPNQHAPVSDPPNQYTLAQHASGDPGLNFHQDVVRILRATDKDGPEVLDFKTAFKNKNAHVKRTITRAINVLTPLESAALSHLHGDDFSLLRDHIRKIDLAIASLHAIIDNDAYDISERDMVPFSLEAEAHVPAMLDLRARINMLEKSFKDSLAVPPPPAASAPPPPLGKVDNTFKPKPLDRIATPAMFHKWKQNFQIYVERNGFERAPLRHQRILLSNCLTNEMEDALDRICLPKETDTLEQVFDSMERHLIKSNNLTARRFAYFNCVQGDNETIREYIIRFRKLGDYANFDQFTYNENMVCRLLTGIKDDALRKELLRLKENDFDTVHDYVLAWEDSNLNAEFIMPRNGSTSGAPGEDLGIEKISAYRSSKRSTFGNVRQHQSKAQKDPSDHQSSRPGANGQLCFNCGNTRHPLTDCPARSKKCNYCNKMGHFSKVCNKLKADKKKASGPQSVQAVEENTPSDQLVGDHAGEVGSFGFHILNIDDRIRAQTPKINATLSFGKICLGMHHLVPDTGAAVSVLPLSLLKLWNLKLEPMQSEHSLRAATGDPINCYGTVRLNVNLNGIDTDVTFFVCDNVSNIIVSWMALKNLLVISPKFPEQDLARISTLGSHQVLDHDQSIAFKTRCLSHFSSVFNNKSCPPQMRGAPMTIHLSDNFSPDLVTQISKPRPVPIPLKDAVRGEIESMISRGIIRPIQEPTTFVSPMVIVPKKNNKIRIVVDYTQVNRFVKRPSHPFPSVAEVRALIPPHAKFFATLDATQGYLQIPLDEVSQPLTTFLTPWGRFCFLRAPMGLSASGDVFCARGDRAFEGVRNIIKVVDDILVHAETKAELFDTVQQVLQAAADHGISLSADKFYIGSVVDFVGLTISHDCIKPDAKHFKAISEFPEPKNRTDLRSFLGVINQFSSFSTNIARLARPLRPLLSKQSQWTWDASHKQAFQALRNELVHCAQLHCFDPKRNTKLLTDALKLHGLGYALMQQVGDSWVLVSCGSRFISDTESNYAVFELEALAIVWAITKCRIFLLGLPHFRVVTDHRPLVTIFNSTRLTKTDNPRIVRLMQKISMYSFKVEWTPGRLHNLPDALSRAPVSQAEQSEIAQVDDAPIRVHADLAVRNMAVEASKDSSYQDIVHAVRTLPLKDVKKLPTSTHSHVRILTSLWDRLSVDKETGFVLLDSSRILVPPPSRMAIIKQVHIAHQGITRSKARMQALYFWPGMSNEIVQAVESCNLCQMYRDRTKPEPIQAHDKPPRPFYAASTDIFEYKGTYFLSYVDRFLGWPSVIIFSKSPSSKQVIAALLEIFKDFGFPNRLRHDGATPYVSLEFKDFLRRHSIIDELSSAYNPQSNGHAEASVKSMKTLAKKCWLKNSLDKNKFAEAILEWRNVPKYPGNLSPAEMVFGRKLRTGAPCLYYRKLSEKDIQRAVSANYNHIRKSYDHANISRKSTLPLLAEKDSVLIWNPRTHLWDKFGQIIRSRNAHRSYFVQSDGKTLLRSRRFLKKTVR